MDKLSVVKIGGNVIEDAKQLADFLSAFSQMQGAKILVHGGGKKATVMAKKLGVPVKIIEGRRITDAENLDIITMLYGGKINKNIVAQLQAIGCNAIGLSGADGNAIKAVKRPKKEIDFGFVGDIEKINDEFLLNLLNSNLTPTICSLTHDNKGQILNTNADTIASELGIAMAKYFNVTLKYCFDKSGVLMDQNTNSSIKKNITKKEFKKLVEEEIISDGMIPKLENCFNALENGVNNIYIGDLDIINSIENCTKITL